MSEKAAQEWPIIQETTNPRVRAKGIREFTIQDARNSWEVKIERVVDEWKIKMVGFKKFYFVYGTKDLRLRCFKDFPVRVSDSGEIASHDHRFNLVNDQEERKTLRLKAFKTYLEKIV